MVCHLFSVSFKFTMACRRVGTVHDDGFEDGIKPIHDHQSRWSRNAAFWILGFCSGFVL